MLGSAPAMAFTASTDLERSREFYVDALGLPQTDLTPFALVLQAHGTMVRVTKVDSLGAIRFKAPTPAGP